jgi:hypothetical protein
MSRFVAEVERTIALARRSRKHVLRILETIESAPRPIARLEQSVGSARIAIALASLSACDPVMLGAAHNLNRRARG